MFYFLALSYLVGILIVGLLSLQIAWDCSPHTDHRFDLRVLRDLLVALIAAVLWPVSLLIVLSLTLVDEWRHQARLRKKIEVSLIKSDRKCKGMNNDDN